MKCEDALILISGHLDGENTAEEETALLAHLSICEHCRNVMDALKQMDADLSELSVCAPEGFCDGVMAQIKKERTRKKIRPWYPIAAALALVIGIGATFGHTDTLVEPQTASVAETYTMARGVSADAHTVAEAIVAERGAPVAVVRELYYEIEACECETLAEGYVLYVLQDPDGAAALAENYGCAIYAPIGEWTSSVSYALLAP